MTLDDKFKYFKKLLKVYSRYSDVYFYEISQNIDNLSFEIIKKNRHNKIDFQITEIPLNDLDILIKRYKDKLRYSFQFRLEK